MHNVVEIDGWRGIYNRMDLVFTLIFLSLLFYSLFSFSHSNDFHHEQQMRWLLMVNGLYLFFNESLSHIAEMSACLQTTETWASTQTSGFTQWDQKSSHAHSRHWESTTAMALSPTGRRDSAIQPLERFLDQLHQGKNYFSDFLSSRLSSYLSCINCTGI